MFDWLKEIRALFPEERMKKVFHEVPEPYGYYACVPYYHSEDKTWEPMDDLHIAAFMESCAVSEAAVFMRDSVGYTWCVYNMRVYRACCQRFGFSPTDNLLYPGERPINNEKPID